MKNIGKCLTEYEAAASALDYVYESMKNSLQTCSSSATSFFMLN